ncbi:hypothetical protein FDE29_15285 [Vibrio parahaemolyticus]|uniref:hypothetical protein n=4 Tax=Vibrio parahaemolyticus TaxID=670 RepID=UPI00041703F2|nr:hypothetical protein [Vibrio parahaemolyticus]EGR0439719.1 hypothetical protein [Vibrio parahaemolyticus]EGR2568587.1 hypothetical protein [Vibrio parahaemolyticus]EGR3330642.1 hypothetical protein [Vibrio parahaemolyticus]EJG1275454.1 hypothetical protein [Vibrio parahaemolyticus]EJG1280191.1 hypothetical protein [Vibrio parahaemolyticus]
MKSVFFFERLVRVFLLVGIVYIVNELLPLFQGAKDLNILYPIIKEYGVEWIIGNEWVLLGGISAILSVIFWHTLFFSAIKGRNWCIGKINRNILIKSYDYFWYFGSFISVLITLGILNHTHLMDVEDQISKNVHNHELLLNSSKKILDLRCGSVDDKVMNSPLDRKVLTVCSFNKYSEDIRLKACKTAEIGSEDSEFTSDRTDSYKDLSDFIFIHCNSLRQLEVLYDERSDVLKKIESKNGSIFNKLFWTFFLPVIIGFRVVKTSIEFSDERRKIVLENKNNKEIDRYLLKYIYPSTYMSK